MRSTCGVDDVSARVDAESPENRRREIGRSDRVRFGIRSDTIAGTVDLTTANAATGEDHRIAVRPVIPPGAGVDRWCPAEFTGRNHERAFQKSALVQVFNQSGESPIGLWQQVLSILAEVVRVRVPVLTLLPEVIDVDEGNARFDQPSCQQQIAASQISSRRAGSCGITRLRGWSCGAVTLQSRSTFTADLKSIRQRR